MHKTLRVCLLLAASCSHAATTIVLPLDTIDDWQTHSFVGEAEFQWQDSDNCLLMRSAGTASARIWEQTLPLTPQTTLSWQWQPRVNIQGVDQRSKTGGDFPARVYVAVQHPVFFWRSRVLTYVHADQEPVDSTWTNPFSGQFEMVVVSNGNEPIWHTIERNLSDDWFTAFGDRPEEFHAVGIMSDSDNSGQSTELCMSNLSIVSSTELN